MKGRKEVGRCVGITNIATPDGQILHTCGVFSISLGRKLQQLLSHTKNYDQKKNYGQKASSKDLT